MVYKTPQVTWCCPPMIVVVLGFLCLYFALYLGIRQSRFALFDVTRQTSMRHVNVTSRQPDVDVESQR